MKRICLWFLCLATVLTCSTFVSAVDLSMMPPSPEKEALTVPYFPNRLCTFVWRNWNQISLERMAKAVGTSESNLKEIAALMGLPAYKEPTWTIAQNYITIVRYNWHLLPYEQMLVLLDMSAEKLAFNLKEDDFLYVKLGNLKPHCEPLNYKPLTDTEKSQLAAIVKKYKSEMGDLLNLPEEPRFQFIKDLTSLSDEEFKPLTTKSRFEIRYIYSYFALFGDPLADPNADIFPDGLLQKLAAHGVNGVWLHVVLRDLAPGGPDFPEFGAGHEQRIASLKKAVDRAKKFGINLYLYMNEPRAMPTRFFEKHADIAGAVEPHRDLCSMCISCPKVRKWLGDSLAYLFREVPGLGGIFTITASENFTTCASHGMKVLATCPRCSKREYADIIADVNTIMAEGVHRSAPDAKVIVWDWGWAGNAPQPEIIAKLPENVYLMSVSEWFVPINRGFKTKIGEYSISAVGPGPRATIHWAAARNRGLKPAAKVQFNTTWELGGVPYIPTMDLVAEHCHNLATSGVTAVQLSWSLGGYPSMNLKIPLIFDREPLPTVDEALDELALELYGKEGKALARQGWTAMSKGFTEFPYSNVYSPPYPTGPANFLYWEPTKYPATMVGIPYDAIRQWAGVYPLDIYASQLEKTSQGFEKGSALLAKAAEKATSKNRREVMQQVRMGKTAGVIYGSIANQIHFVQLRDELRNAKTAETRKQEIKTELKKIVRREIDYAKQLYVLCKEDSTIGFESTNHYWYVPNDLVEKVINCQNILAELEK